MTSDTRNYVVISADGHCGAPLRDYKDYLEKRFHDDFERWADTYVDAWAELDADHDANDRIGMVSFDAPLNWDSAARIEFTESQGIAAEVLFPNTSPPFIPSGSVSAPGPRSTLEYEQRFAGVRAHNRWLVDFCADAPGRRAGFAQVFLDDLDAAIQEVRWAREAGLMGVLLPNDHVLKMANLYYPKFDPFWAACAELDLPVHRHTVAPCESAAEGGPAAPWMGLLEVSFYGTRAIAHMICAGVFERHPNLKFVTTELGNGAEIPDYLRRLDDMYSSATTGQARDSRIADAITRLNLTRLPSEYFASNCFVAGPLDLRSAIDAGTPNIMFGADVPHSEGTAPYTREALRWSLDGLGEPTVRQITSITAADVYGFDLEFLQAVADRVGPTVDEIATPLSDEEVPEYPGQTRSPLFASSTSKLVA